MNSRRFWKVLSVGLLSAALAACTAAEEKKSKHLAPENIDESLKPGANAAPLAQDNGLIRLKKASLGKAFLMSPTMVIASNSPILDTLQPLVVSFERSGDQLGLFEMNLQSFYSELPADRLLQTFVIARETQDEILFKWSYGLEFLSQRGNGYASDGPADEQTAEINKPEEEVFPTVATFVRKAFIADNTLYIEQVSRLRNQNFSLSMGALQQGQPATVNASDVTIQIDVRIRPYVPSTTFRPKESELLKGIGFFEQYTWSRENRRAVIEAQRWDLDPARGPLVYALTSNTPAEYVDAVREGILYWNIVLGREAIKVETGADPREPARERRVLVHWIDWPDAGFARAALQADPFTGELLGGNVYMTSVFALGAEISARQESRRTDRPVRSAVLSGFRPATGCLQDLGVSLESAFPSASSPDPAVVKRFAQDIVRATVAHEVGHTLGLRHNFAGNLASQVKDWAEQRRLEKDYLANGLTDGFATGSTVMDYSFNLDTAMLGSFIRRSALAYDTKAMQWGYLTPAATAASLAAPPFCTDWQAGMTGVLGCERFDGGRNPLVAKSELMAVGRNEMTMRLARSLILSLRPLPPLRGKTPEELREVADRMKLETRINRVFSSSNNLKSYLLKDTLHWRTKIELGEPGWMSEDKWKARNLELVKGEWAAVGGLSSVIAKALPFEGGGLAKGWLSRQAQAALQNPELRSGVTLEGVKYDLSEAEHAVVGEVLLAFAEAAEEPYVLTAMGKLSFAAGEKAGSKAAVIDTNLLPAGEEARLGDLAAGVVLPSDETRKVGVGETVVEVPVARQSADVRGAALRWVAPKTFGREDWAAAARERMHTELVRRLTLLGASGNDAASLKKSLASLSLKDDAQEWAAGEIAVLSALEGLVKE